jgi:rhodanese-related sulfurtransferase
MTGGIPHLPDAAATEEVTARDVAGWISLPETARPRLIDCREAEELEICRIAGHEWLALSDFPAAVDALRADAGRGIVVYCHHGMRSLRAARFLRANGIENAFSMAGGIDAWSRLIDHGVPRY